MKKLLLISIFNFSFLIYQPLLVVNCFAQPNNKGPYEAGWTSATLNREGRALNTITYYPAFVEGSEAQIDTLHGPYQVIAFGHGFFMQNSYYISHFKHLASYGYVVIAPQFPDNNHLQLAYDLIFCVDYIKTQNSVSTSRFYNLIDLTKAGLSGHSMGGGASLLAAANDSTITVAAPLAAAETNPSAINVMNQIKGVVYLISAQSDGITPPPQHQIPMYNNANPVKALPLIKGANHTKFMDTRIWDWTDPNGYLTATQQLASTRKYMASIFNLFLKEDTSYFKYAFGDLAQSDTSIIFQYELKPLMPKSFNLISPQDTLYQSEINFLWHSTYSLNLYDQIEYEIIVAADEQFNNIVLQIGQLTDTTYSTQLQNGEYFWIVKAYTSALTYTLSNVLSFVVDFPTNVKSENDIPSEFYLGQNYPNPFNPSTKIKFTIPQSPLLGGDGRGGFVTVKVYDVLGNEVATLVDEYKSAGSYEVEFGASSGISKLVSGIYFYQLKAGEFIQTKKMLMIK
ncbi:MAG TPA: T9SS type A sorting domain-containing protein [Ignavibacteriaceae bacterium]|nr:T9SS type A sorting domain-containing protein [Ignavibacteriaceae bacterium]